MSNLLRLAIEILNDLIILSTIIELECSHFGNDSSITFDDSKKFAYICFEMLQFNPL